jgi:hypothetical protein
VRLLGLAVLWLLLLSVGARAEDIGPAQAQALQQQLKDWLAGLLGPAVKLPDLPWRVTGATDHYVIVWPIPGLTDKGGEVVTTTNVRPLDGGRWSIDDMKLPPSGSFTMNMPNGEGGANTPMTVNFSVGRQDTHGVIDPALASPSTLRAEIGDLVVSTDNANQRQEQRFDHYVASTSLKPVPDGRLDLTMDTKVEGWKSASQVGGGTPVAIGIQAMQAVGHVGGVKRERVAALLAATGSLIGTLPPDVTTKGAKSDLPPAARAQLRLMIGALQDMLTSVSLEETVDGVQVEVAGMGGASIKRIQFGFGGESPDGTLRAWLNVGLDELASPSLPPKMAAYLPHHFEIKPTVSGIMTADLHKLALDAAEEGDDDKFGPDIAALFSHGGIEAGLETLAFDLGPAKFVGVGQLTVLSPDEWHGKAHIVATGFDELTNQARTNPELQQALPALVMMRGMAKPDGQKLVWDIVSDGPSVTVNGLDLSQMGGGEKPKGKPQAVKPGQQRSR